jgi:hypothetical protein
MKFGPQRDAAGLGDVLLFTAICKHFPMQHTIQLYPEISRFRILFDHLANVEITEDVNVLKDVKNPSAHASVEKLRNFFGKTADTCNPLPLVLHFDIDAHEKAVNILEGIEKPVIFNPYCAKRWAHVRNMPKDVIDLALNQIKYNKQTPIGCYSSKNHQEVTGVKKEIIDLDLSTYIHLLRIVGEYFGTNTGDMHLAAAVGCKINCYNPPSQSVFNHINWLYKHPTVTNYKYHND